MSDLEHHDDEEHYHFDDSESFDFGEHDNTEEEFVGDEEIVESTDTKQWDNERPVAASAEKSNVIKKIWMGAGFVILLAAGYYFMMPHGNTSTPVEQDTITRHDTTKATTTQAQAQKPAANTATPVATNNTSNNTDLDNAADDAWLGGDSNDTSSTTTASDAQAASTTTASTSSDTQAATTTTANDSLSMQIQTLNEQNQTLTLQLQQVTAQSEETELRAESLEKTVAQLQAQMQQMQASAASAPKPHSAAVSHPSTKEVSTTDNTNKTAITYYVQAIIPGRAWIEDSNGHIVTVTEGDRFEALNSTVKTIDPINGLVTLNNGMQIEYGMVAQ